MKEKQQLHTIIAKGGDFIINKCAIFIHNANICTTPSALVYHNVSIFVQSSEKVTYLQYVENRPAGCNRRRKEISQILCLVSHMIHIENVTQKKIEFFLN